MEMEVIVLAIGLHNANKQGLGLKKKNRKKNKSHVLSELLIFQKSMWTHQSGRTPESRYRVLWVTGKHDLARASCEGTILACKCYGSKGILQNV